MPRLGTTLCHLTLLCMCNVCVCLCVHMHACVCVCVSVSVSVCVCVHAICMWADVYVGRCVCGQMCAPLCLCLCVCKFVIVRFLHALLCQHCHSTCLPGQMVAAEACTAMQHCWPLVSPMHRWAPIDLQACWAEEP